MNRPDSKYVDIKNGWVVFIFKSKNGYITPMSILKKYKGVQYELKDKKIIIIDD